MAGIPGIAPLNVCQFARGSHWMENDVTAGGRYAKC